jgi:hypothetical protein
MNEPRRLVEVGTFPAGYATTFADGADPVARLVAEAAAKLDAEAAEAEWARLAAIADQERLANTRRARPAWRFRRAVKALTRIK